MFMQIAQNRKNNKNSRRDEMKEKMNKKKKRGTNVVYEIEIRRSKHQNKLNIVIV